MLGRHWSSLRRQNAVRAAGPGDVAISLRESPPSATCQTLCPVRVACIDRPTRRAVAPAQRRSSRELQELGIVPRQAQTASHRQETTGASSPDERSSPRIDATWGIPAWRAVLIHGVAIGPRARHGGRRCAVGSPTGRAGCPKTLDHATLHDPVLAHESADHRATACPRRYRGSPLLDVMRVSP